MKHNTQSITSQPLFTHLLEHRPELLHTLSVPARTTLLLEGNIANHLYIIQQGIVRLWHASADGHDITLQFFGAGQAVCSFESFYLGTPSQFSLESVSDCTLLSFHRKEALTLLTENPEIQPLVTDYICHRFIDYTTLFLSRIQLSPEERYRALLADDPALLDKVPHHMLASYLGISATSLSRIRRRIAEEDCKKFDRPLQL